MLPGKFYLKAASHLDMYLSGEAYIIVNVEECMIMQSSVR